MSLKIDRVQLEIIVQQDSARQQMLELEKQMKSANLELGKLKKQFGENSAEYKAQQQVVQKLKQQYDDLFNQIGIGHLSMRELANRQRELNAILRNLDPSLPEWKQYNQQLKEVNNRIKELRGTATETRLSLGKLADGFNRYMGLAAGAIASITGLTLTMRQSVEEYAKMEEAESQVIKYTGMTREEVKQLNEQFKAMDTRTSREELNRLAGEAGKLGITGIEEVRDFVEAADMINVALGEDLGEEAVNQIGKLSQMFGDESRSLKDNMLAIGSAVNQVAQSTSASEPYLVEFTARMGGVGKQANMSVTDIMGFASALDQNMLRSEMASTALSGLILRLYQEPAKYAKLAQMDVQQFTEVMQRDANAAVLMFLESLSKMGGMANIAPVLKEMSLTGAEAASVITTLAGNIDLIRKEQANANQAFREGTSAVNEFTVQNNTVQAQLEKARNSFQTVRVELGERLLPIMQNMISFGSLTVKGLLELIRIYNEYKGVIAGATTGLITYIAYQKINVAWTKLSQLWTTRFNGSLKVLGKTLMTNIWGIALAGIGAFIGHLHQARSESKRMGEELTGMRKVIHETGSEFAQQEGKIRALTTVINDSGVALNTRREALKKLKEIIPGYNALLTDEGTLTRNNTEAIKAYLVQLEKQIKMQAAVDELSELYKRQRELTSLEAEQSDEYWDIRSTNTLQGFERNSLPARMSRLFGMSKEDNALKRLQATQKELQTIAGQIEEINKEIETSEILSNSSKAGSGDASSSLRSGLSPALAGPASTGTDFQSRQSALEQQYRTEVNLLKEKYLNEQLTQEDYQRQMAAAELAYLEMRKSLYMEFGKDASDIQGQIYDKMIAEADRRNQEQQKFEEDWLNEQTQMIKEANKQIDDYKKQDKEAKIQAVLAESDPSKQVDMLKEMYDKDIINYREYQSIKSQIAEGHENGRLGKAQKAMQYISQAAQAGSQLIQALQDREISKVEQRYDKQIEAAQKAGKDTTKLEEEKEAAVSEIKKKYADKQFAMNILQIVSDTAAGIMRGYATLGPILGSIYAAIIAAQGAAQVVVAQQQREEAKGLYSGGYSDEYAQGYTKKGNPRETAGVIPVHKNEFVANHEAVANPAVKQFLDVFDLAQKRGTIRMLNTTQILEQVRIGKGRYQGGYAGENTAPSRSSASPIAGMTAEQRSQVVVLLQENNRLLTILTEKELVVDPRKVRDGIKHIENLERNISR